MRWVVALKIRIIKNQIQWRKSAATNVHVEPFYNHLNICWENLCIYVLTIAHMHTNRNVKMWKIEKSVCRCLHFQSFAQDHNIFFLHSYSIEIIQFYTRLKLSVSFSLWYAVLTFDVHTQRLSNVKRTFLRSSSAQPIGMLTQWYLHFSQIFLITCWRLNAISRKRFVFVVVWMWLYNHYFAGNFNEDIHNFPWEYQNALNF